MRHEIVYDSLYEEVIDTLHKLPRIRDARGREREIAKLRELIGQMLIDGVLCADFVKRHYESLLSVPSESTKQLLLAAARLSLLREKI